MTQSTPHLIRTLSLGWLAYFLLGLTLKLTAPSASSGSLSTVFIIIDRGYCPPAQWQQVAADYDQLYQQHQNQQIQIESVTLVNNLGEEVRTEPPTAAEIAALNPFGLDGGDRIPALLASQPDATVLRCPI
ncbi:MAG: hypothetical protein VKJ64_19450 [Leptolyngbyaceae bacterium]|nr:hypothetical protein [Leptolyngbyaceae bacterium]